MSFEEMTADMLERTETTTTMVIRQADSTGNRSTAFCSWAERRECRWSAICSAS